MVCLVSIGDYLGVVGLIYMAEPINDIAGENWKLFAGQVCRLYSQYLKLPSFQPHLCLSRRDLYNPSQWVCMISW